MTLFKRGGGVIPLLVRTGKGPFEVLVMLGGTLSGVVGLILPDRASAAVIEILGDNAWIWHLTFAGACIVSLYGIYTSRYPEGLYIERAGMIWVGTLLFAYGIGLFFVDSIGPARNVSGLITIFVGIASFVRAFQITNDLHKLTKAIQETKNGS